MNHYKVSKWMSAFQQISIVTIIHGFDEQLSKSQIFYKLLNIVYHQEIKINLKFNNIISKLPFYVYK